MLQAQLIGILGLVAIAACWGLAVVLYRVGTAGSVAMPNTQNTPEYAAFRKMQVYEEAVSEAHFEGGISPKERALLVRLRDSLGITTTDADAIEVELQAGGAVTQYI
jgi:hypothetical protein